MRPSESGRGAKAKAQAEERRQAEAARNRQPAAPPSEEPDPKAQKNFTDPESRIMKTKDGFIQATMRSGGRRDGAGDRRPRPRREAERSTSIAPMADAIEANLQPEERV